MGAVIVVGIFYLILTFQQSDKEMEEYVVPQLEYAQMQLTRLTAEKADMNMNMIIDNPAPIALNIDSLYYTISIEGNEVVATTYPDSLQIDANDTTMVSLPLTIYYDKLKSVLDRLEQEGRDSATYKVNATIYAENDIIPKDKFNLEVEKVLPVIRTMEVDVTNLSIEDLDFSGATIVVEALVENKNPFPSGFKDMHYSLQIEDNEAVEGSKPGTVKIPAKDTATVSIPVEIDFKEMGKSLIDLIKKGDELSYDFSLRTALVSDEHILEESEVLLKAAGKLRNLKDAAEGQAGDN